MAKHRIVITERDEKILLLLKKFGCVREDLLANYLDLDYTLDSVKIVLSVLAFRLKKHDIINRAKVVIGKTFYWSLAKSGADLVDAEVLKKISIITLNHNDLVTELAINLLIKNPDANLKTEFEIRQELYGREAKEKKIPDLVIDNKIAIEVELSKKNNRKLNSIVSNYLRSDYEEIIYYCDSKSIANTLYKISNKNMKFKYKVFINSSIIDAEIYNPELSKNNDYLRDDDTGQFKSSIEEKIHNLFGSK